KFWYDEECAKITEEKNKAYKEAINKKTRNAKYKEMRKIEKKIHRNKKKTYYEELIKGLEEHHQSNESRKFYKLTNGLRKEFKPRLTMCRNEMGELAKDGKEVLKCWKSHFETLLDGGQYNLTKENEENIIADMEDQSDGDLLPSLEDVREAIEQLKNNRSPGPHNLNAELFKVAEPVLLDKLYYILLQVWKIEKIPSEWEQGIICPIFKTGDPTLCHNYRGITLLNIIYKIFSVILFKKIRPYAEKQIKVYQCGFKAGKSTIDQIHTLRQILQKLREFKIHTYHLFIDFKAAYDSIDRQELFKVMEEFEIPKKLINLTKATLKNVKCRVKIQNQPSDEFMTHKGLRQGDALSCLLFNIALEKVIRESNIDTPYLISLYNC
ncbi:hypothetical protein C0J52_20054, partial [Blattella germanica]